MPSEPGSVVAIVLAAGSSRRMGRNKLLLDLGGESVVRRAVRRAAESSVDRVLVVVGHEAGRVEGELRGLPCTTVPNPDHERGAGTSLRAGVREALPLAGAVVVLLADMPFVESSMITAVVDHHRTTGAGLVLSFYGEVQAPPTLYSRAYFQELLAVSDEGCAKKLVRRHQGEAAVLHWPTSSLRDLDLEGDYEELAPKA